MWSLSKKLVLSEINIFSYESVLFRISELALSIQQQLSLLNCLLICFNCRTIRKQRHAGKKAYLILPLEVLFQSTFDFLILIREYGFRPFKWYESQKQFVLGFGNSLRLDFLNIRKSFTHQITIIFLPWESNYFIIKDFFSILLWTRTNTALCPHFNLHN